MNDESCDAKSLSMPHVWKRNLDTGISTCLACERTRPNRTFVEESIAYITGKDKKAKEELDG